MNGADLANSNVKNGANYNYIKFKNGADSVLCNWRYEFMYRKDSIAIGEWIKNSNKALLVTGAYVKIGLNQEKPYKTRV